MESDGLLWYRLPIFGKDRLKSGFEANEMGHEVCHWTSREEQAVGLPDPSYVVQGIECKRKKTTTKHFGSFERALIAMDANTGSEYDIIEEWEDYSVFRSMERNSLHRIIRLLRRVTRDKKIIRQFLHLDYPTKHRWGEPASRPDLPHVVSNSLTRSEIT